MLAAVLAAPDDEAPRLILCDLLCDEGEEELAEAVRNYAPEPEPVVKAVYGRRAWVWWQAAYRRPFVFRWSVIAPGHPEKEATKMIREHLRGGLMLELPEVRDAVARARAEGVVKLVRERMR
jgi:uncharacterized protein (TIGR02996 family)